MKRLLAAVLILLPAIADAHVPYDDNRFSGAGASGAWEVEATPMRGHGFATYCADSPETFRTACSLAVEGDERDVEVEAHELCAKATHIEIESLTAERDADNRL